CWSRKRCAALRTSSSVPPTLTCATPLRRSAMPLIEMPSISTWICRDDSERINAFHDRIDDCAPADDDPPRPRCPGRIAPGDDQRLRGRGDLVGAQDDDQRDQDDDNEDADSSDAEEQVHQWAFHRLSWCT